MKMSREPRATNYGIIHVMRILFLSDIHGVPSALEAAFASDAAGGMPIVFDEER